MQLCDNFVFMCIEFFLILALHSEQNDNYEYLFRFSTNYGGVEDESQKLPLPEEEEIFKTGSNFVNFVHLYIVIGKLSK